jgi:predicted SAM-dependent methyltransferase
MKLHVGCGKRDFGKEWTHVDGGDFPHVTSHDVFLKDIPDNSADIIYSSHLIEYFDRQEVTELLKAWYRVLKPRGELFVAVPDFSAINKLYQDKEYELEQFLGLLYGRMEMNGNKIYHKTVYDFKSLCRVLAGAGFYGIFQSNIKDYLTDCGNNWHWRLPDDHSKAVLPHMSMDGTPVSLNVIACKP